MPTPLHRRLAPLATLLATIFTLAGCVSIEPVEGPPRKETVFAATASGELIRFNAGQPSLVLSRVTVSGLDSGDRLVGIDFRMSRGMLFALSARGRLYTLDTASGKLTAVGPGVAQAAADQAVGFDFNPAADRLRVVTTSGRNLRLHPDSGALAAEDPALRYANGDAAAVAAAPARIGAAAYTYNKADTKLTTNYAIDLARGTLVRQGSQEGVQPAVSPNTGLLATVGALGTGTVDDAAFDIADVSNAALAALRRGGVTQLHLVDLGTGKATPLGRVADGQALTGLAIEP